MRRGNRLVALTETGRDALVLIRRALQDMKRWRLWRRRGKAATAATDASVIKAYVESGLGVAVLQKLAIEPGRDRSLRVIPAGHLFPSSMAMLSLRRDHFMRCYTYDFIRRVAPAWSRSAVDEAMAR